MGEHQPISAAVEYFGDIDLESVNSIEEVLFGTGKYIKSEDICDIPHPRETFKIIKFLKNQYYHDAGYEKLPDSEYRDSLNEIARFEKKIKKIEDDRKREYAENFYASCKNAASRLKSLEYGDRGKGTIIRELEKNREISIQRAEKYGEISNGVLDAAVGFGSAAVGYYITDEAVVALASGAAAVLLFKTAGRYFTEWAKDTSVKRIERRYQNKIDSVRETYKEKKEDIILQTIMEIANDLGEKIPGSVITISDENEYAKNN